jgi:serine/threonine-protein kinase RsbW
MRMRIAFSLPRTAESVPVARHVLDRIFNLVGVRRDCRDEIAVAVSEACTNAVRHGGGKPVYELAAEAVADRCVITVDSDSSLPEAPIAMPAPEAANGRGLALMRFMTDSLELRRRRGGGLSVRMSKTLSWNEGAIGCPPP